MFDQEMCGFRWAEIAATDRGQYRTGLTRPGRRLELARSKLGIDQLAGATALGGLPFWQGPAASGTDHCGLGWTQHRKAPPPQDQWG